MADARSEMSPRSSFLMQPHCLRWIWLAGVFICCSLTLALGLAATTFEYDQAQLLKQYTSQPEVGSNGKVSQSRPTLEPQAYAELAGHLRELYAQSADQWPKPTLGKDVEFVELGPVPAAVFPEGNPYTKAKAELGKILFFDPRLSGSQQMACASCHEPDLAWADGRTVSFGHFRMSLKRNSPSLLNVAHGRSMFWDGRAASLEEQALIVIQNPVELNADLDQVVQTLQSSSQYIARFKEAFGDQPITSELLAKALATYQRTIRSTGRSDFDRFLAGEKNTLSDSAIRGLHLFRTAAGCVNCHHGPLMTDHQFHDLGLSYYGRKLQDLGRYEVTRKPQDVGAFKTPSLRNVTRTAPYMHVGLFDMEGVLNMYNAGMPTLRRKPDQMDDPLFPTKSHLLRPLGLNKQDMEDLQAFLKALEEPRRRIRPPQPPEADLKTQTTQPEEGIQNLSLQVIP